jgi:hypothetical protein
MEGFPAFSLKIPVSHVAVKLGNGLFFDVSGKR